MNASIHNCMDDQEIAHNVNMVRGQAMCECTHWAFSMQGECTWKAAELNNPEPTRG